MDLRLRLAQRITPAAGEAFNTISFFHFQSGEPNGSVVRDLSFEVASGAAPEPSTWVMMLLGFAGLGFAGYRASHRLARSPSLAEYCRSPHLLVSLSGDPHGFVDDLLAKRGLKRRIALTVSTFMMALAHLASSDLIAALPRRLVATYAARFDLVSAELPFKRKPDPIFAIATRAAMMDDGIAWLMGVLVSSAASWKLSNPST
jgi:DNA-binding transcriptional LysR family regulator